MKPKSRYIVSWVTLGVVLLLGYFISFTYFVHAHERVAMRGPRGQGVTMVIVSVPDTLMNRCLVAFYTPIWCGLRRDSIEWDP